MAGRDGTSDSAVEGKDFKWVTNSNGTKTRKFFTKAEKEAMKSGGDKPTASTKSKPRTSGSKPKKDVVASAREAIDRSEPTRPKARPGTTRPKARPNRETATSVSTPEVTTTTLPKAGGATYKGYTWEQYKEGNNLGRLRQGLPMGLSKSEFEARANGEGESKPTRNSGTAGRAARRSASRGYAKGGMVKANCGASMKPTQKSTKKKGY